MESTICTKKTAALTPAEQDGLDYLRKALPDADLIALEDETLLKIVRQANLVRAAVPWGAKIPENIFKAFVLFPRVNNEDPQLYMETIWGQLKDRVLGKSMEDAIKEVNYWAYEKATYQATDGRTLNALATMRRSYGRCGEESTLLVSALRSAGIPARQVYVPLWSHCDSNHAWVEAWADGEWKYLGACEPEPVLNSGWFTAAASKAMLVHTRAYGVEPEGETVDSVVGNAYILNRTAAYAQTRTLTVTVTENGQPKPGLTVRFELVNFGMYNAINEKTTDEAGSAKLLTGLGLIHVHVTDGERFVARTVDVAKEDTCLFDFAEATDGKTGPTEFIQRPPQESRIQPTVFPAEVKAAHTARMQACEAVRAAYEATFRTETPFYTNARGNHAVLEAFLALPGYEDEDKQALLGTLREKDFVDFSVDVLKDALDGALLYKGRYPREVWVDSVLRPRVFNEMLLPVRGFIRDFFADDAPKDVFALWDRLSALAEAPTEPVIPDFRAALSAGRTSRPVKEMLFIACGRALGFAVRMNPITGEKEYYDGSAYKALAAARQSDAELTLVNISGRELHFGSQLSVSVLRNGAFEPLRLFGKTLKDTLTLPVNAGTYRIMTCTRQIDGSINGRMAYAVVEAGGSASAEVDAAPESAADAVVSVALPQIAALSGEAYPAACAGKPSIMAILAPGQEPTEHLLNELLEAAPQLADADVAVRLLVTAEAELSNAKLQKVLAELTDVTAAVMKDPADIDLWRGAMHAGDARLPFAAAVDAEGRGRFAFANYAVGSARSLLGVLTVK